MLEKKGVKVDKVLNFAIDDAILEERITGRWMHPSSGRTYHTKFAPPKVPGVDDVRLFPFQFFWFKNVIATRNLINIQGVLIRHMHKKIK
jgi:adenylate kinase family enzyme